MFALGFGVFLALRFLVLGDADDELCEVRMKKAQQKIQELAAPPK
jgi:hypothetical protein